MAHIVFTLAVVALGYTWLGYPLILASLNRRARYALSRRGLWPRVSVIIAAFNEADSIVAKIDSTLRQRYPADRLEVIVVSDGSTDGTDEIVRRHTDRRVRLLRQDPRAGKSMALNRGVAAASGDVLIFTDANALFAPAAIARLAAPFVSSEVGLVSGQGLYAAAATAGDARAVANGYVRYEARIRTGEARLGFLAGADGAIYALRRSLYTELGPAQVNDLLHPIQAALAGFRCGFDPEAYTIEPPSDGAGQEFGRHVRIIAQGVHIVRDWLPRLVGARRWREAWMLASHRVLRWATAPLLVAALAANVVLVRKGVFWHATLAAQVGFYTLALAGFVAERLRLRIGALGLPYYFCVVAAAGVTGVVRFVRTGAQSVWAPTSAATERAA
jgi:cellulose synthase/poly-beta-1,6-N-acetylglucosamine synthase-like glycosyltransferase